MDIYLMLGASQIFSACANSSGLIRAHLTSSTPAMPFHKTVVRGNPCGSSHLSPPHTPASSPGGPCSHVIAECRSAFFQSNLVYVIFIIYLAAPDLSCSKLDLLVVACELLTVACEISFPNWESNPGPPAVGARCQPLDPQGSPSAQVLRLAGH